jgi:prepilin-type N-terminal cleavage/methylation domain-containing protein
MKSIPNRATRKMQGFTLIEMIVVVALAAIILGGMAYYIAKAFGSNQAKDEAAAIVHTLASLKDYQMRDGTYPSNVMLTMRRANDVPVPWTTPGTGTPSNTYGGSVLIVGKGTYVQVRYTGIPKDVCNKFVVRFSRNIAIKETQVNMNANRVGEVAPAEAEADCDSDSNMIMWNTGISGT